MEFLNELLKPGNISVLGLLIVGAGLGGWGILWLKKVIKKNDGEEEDKAQPVHTPSPLQAPLTPQHQSSNGYAKVGDCPARHDIVRDNIVDTMKMGFDDMKTILIKDSTELRSSINNVFKKMDVQHTQVLDKITDVNNRVIRLEVKDELEEKEKD